MIAVLGSGVWGLTIARVLIKNNQKVSIWSHSESEINNIKKTGQLKNISVKDVVDDFIFDLDLKNIVTNADIIIFAMASPYVREIANKIKTYINNNTIIVILTKGIEKETLFTMSQIVEDELKTESNKNISIVSLSGPTIAYEVAKDMPTTILSACKDLDIAKKIQDIFMNENFRVYTNQDIDLLWVMM